MSDQLDKVVAALGDARPLNSTRTNWVAKCPAHKDNTPSLRISGQSNGRVLLHCFAGCGALEILDKIGLEWGDLFPDDQYHRSLIRQAKRTGQQEKDRYLIFIAEDHIAQGIRLSEDDKHAYHAAKLRGRR